ncbi:hypothetical protein KHP57_16950, partial [Algiphilus sp. NNCM1]|nr:hypothetical protein [Algiphilus acroporae]
MFTTLSSPKVGGASTYVFTQPNTSTEISVVLSLYSSTAPVDGVFAESHHSRFRSLAERSTLAVANA